MAERDPASTCYLIDSSVYFFRYYFSISYSHQSKSGREVASVLAFTRWLLAFMRELNPCFISCCFDESLGRGYRHDIDPGYKRDRALPDEALSYELQASKEIAELCGVPVYASQKYEADDLLAALTKASRAQGLQPVLVSRDKDLAQLLTQTSGLFWDHGHGEPQNFHQFAERFGVAPDSLGDYLAIIGDAVDNIDGVPSVGKVKGKALMAAFRNWDTIKNDFSAVAKLPIRGADSLRKKLIEHQTRVEHNLKLTRLYDDCLSEEPPVLKRQEPKLDALHRVLDEFNAPATMRKQVETCLG